MYSIGFNGYIDCLEGLQKNVVERKINFASFSKDVKKGIMKNSYYACLKDDNPIKNTIKFNFKDFPSMNCICKSQSKK
jgi:hypothetical protein